MTSADTQRVDANVSRDDDLRADTMQAKPSSLPLHGPEPAVERELAKCRGTQCSPEAVTATRLGESCQLLLPADFSDDHLERLGVTLGGDYVYLSSWRFERLAQGPVLTLLDNACERLLATPQAALDLALHCGSSACAEQAEAERAGLIGGAASSGECDYDCDVLSVNIERFVSDCSFVIQDQGSRVFDTNYVVVYIDGKAVRHRDWRYATVRDEHQITLLDAACDALRVAGEDQISVSIVCKGYYCAERRGRRHTVATE